jgi:oligoribonuclease NrnB/cAMP/cGMP phosphodiesterase (DHH superfamily)
MEQKPAGQELPLKDIVIIYHAECSDGFGAAWSAWKKFGDNASYIPAYHRTMPPEGLDGKEVYTIDYSYSPEMVKEYAARAKKWTIIDHHVTNAGVIPLAASDSLFDLTHSGAYLAWQFFHPGETVPKLISYIEDQDLWQFKLPQAHEICAALSERDLTFESYEKLSAELESADGFAKVLEEGTILRKNLMTSVGRLVKNAEQIVFEGIPCLMVNSANHVSELGAALTKQMPPIALIWSRRGKKIIVSLRSDGSVDVAKLAERYGGGGHPASAGFSWEAEILIEFPPKKTGN